MREESSTEIAREKLYELVWETPMCRLAPQFGVSGRGLAKICERHNIPRPSRGYWAKKAHWKRARRVPLPRGKDGSAILIPRSQPAPPRLRFDDPTVPQVEVPATLEKPHGLVARSAKSLRATDAKGGLASPRSRHTLDVQVSSDLIDRAMLFMNTLLRHLEGLGYAVRLRPNWSRATDSEEDRVAPGRSFVVIDGSEVAFRLYEVTTRSTRLGPKDFLGHRRTYYDYAPTGRLAFEIPSHTRETQARRWYDRQSSTVEKKIGLIVIAMQEVAAAIKIECETDRELKRRDSEWRRIRFEKLTEIREEEHRVRRLELRAQRWREAENIRAFVRACEQASQRDTVDRNWVEWARAHADRIDPLVPHKHSIIDERNKWSQHVYPDRDRDRIQITTAWPYPPWYMKS